MKLHPKATWLFMWNYFWIFLFWEFLAFILIRSAFITVFFFQPGFSSVIVNLFTDIGIIGIVILALVFSFVWSRLTYNAYSYELTNDSFRAQWGVIWKHSSAIPYERIQNIDTKRGIMARLLGLNEVLIQTAGASIPVRGRILGYFSEGHIPGLSSEEAEKLRNTLINKAKEGKQGL